MYNYYILIIISLQKADNSTRNCMTNINVSITSLKAAKVINQVDSKFILCIEDSILFAIDQHAASERINLEKIISGTY